MHKLQRVLLIDDDFFQFQERLTKDFKQNDIDILFCGTKEDAIELIDLGIQFDLIILDWFLEEDDNTLSRLILNQLKKVCFLPVFIWSDYITDFQESQTRGEIAYPDELIQGISKKDVSVSSIQEKASQLFQNSLAAQISGIYRRQIRQGLEKIFFDLIRLPNQDIASILKLLVGEEENIDWSNDFILNLLHRELIRDTGFSEKLQGLLHNAHGVTGADSSEEKRRQILHNVLYYRSDAKVIRNGDIVWFQVGEHITKYGIVITPACDLEQGQTKYLELIELRQFDDQELAINADIRKRIKNFSEPSWYLFPALFTETRLIDFVATFKAKIILEQHLSQEYPVEMKKYPKTPRRMEYADSFLGQQQEITLTFLCSFADPYKSDFLQKLHAHDSRVGVPDIKNLLGK